MQSITARMVLSGAAAAGTTYHFLQKEMDTLRRETDCKMESLRRELESKLDHQKEMETMRRDYDAKLETAKSSWWSSWLG